jgi:hypothetical protein
MARRRSLNDRPSTSAPATGKPIEEKACRTLVTGKDLLLDGRAMPSWSPFGANLALDSWVSSVVRVFPSGFFAEKSEEKVSGKKCKIPLTPRNNLPMITFPFSPALWVVKRKHQAKRS